MDNALEKIKDFAITEGHIDVAALTKTMLQYEQADCPVIHRFGPGLYLREVKIPGGTLAVGHRQKCEHMNLFLKGRVTMLNEDGTTVELKAPMVFSSPPGRKVGYIHEDMVWLNIYPTSETDVETLEKTYIDKNEVWFEDVALQKRINAGNRMADIDDYKKLILEWGLTEKQVRQEVENKSDLISMPQGDYKFLVADSNIEGKGVFATAGIEPGEIIGPARIGRMRTPLVRFCNHSMNPNAETRLYDYAHEINLVSIRKISGCKGGRNGEEITIDYRENLKLIGRKKK